MDRALEWFFAGLTLTCAALITLWTVGAIYFDLARGSRWAGWLAAAWAIGVVVLFAAWQPLWLPFIVQLGCSAALLAWWLRETPRHDGHWDPAVAVLPRADCDGDAVTFANIRNFDYRSHDDFTPRYETRTYRLTSLLAVDAIFFNWGSAIMSHPVLVFDFGSEGRVCISIEVRYRRGQKYSILRSLFHSFELIFLVADERDVILRRTKYGPSQEAHLYRLNSTPDELRSTFIDYVNAINALYDTPRWYHGLCTNCTTTFYRLPSRRLRYDWRVLANARLDRALYAAGRLDRTLPFPQLRQSAYLNDVANYAPENGFGDYVRNELERRRYGR